MKEIGQLRAWRFRQDLSSFTSVELIKMSKIHNENGVSLETSTVNYKYQSINANLLTSRKRYGCNSKKEGYVLIVLLLLLLQPISLGHPIVLFQFRGKAKKDR